LRSMAAALAGTISMVAGAAAQQPAASAMKVDVLAWEGDGGEARGLTADDFEVRAGGQRPRDLKVRYVAPSDAPRTIVFVVDDLGLSFRSAGFVREALERFVAEGMRADDRVAIVRTWSTYSDTDTTQATTSDKKVLREKAAALRYNAGERGPRRSFHDVRYDSMAVAAMECLRAVVRDLTPVPGRKLVVFLSDGIDANLGRFGYIDAVVRQPLEDIVEAANRGSVVVYTADASGVPAPFSDAWSPWRRHAEQLPLRTLAEETGGSFIHNTDIGRGVRQSLDREAGYYVLEYGAAVPKDKAQQIHIKVKKPGVKVRTRKEVFVRVSDPAA